ncbi:MAG TPA: PGF-pre-PGF domain-containing protein [Candidatus Methanoperedens sp.]
MRTKFSMNLIIFLLMGLLFLAAAVGTASAFNFAGYTYNETKGVLNNTMVIVEKYSFGGPGGPQLIGNLSSTSNTTHGYFEIPIDGTFPNNTYNYKIILRHFNATTGSLDYIGQSLPAFPFFEISRLAQGPPIDFYLRPGGTINITATNGTAPQTFRYMIKDTRLGYPISENFNEEVANATVYVPLERNYSIMIYPNQSFPVSYNLNNFTDYGSTNYIVNKTFNTTNRLRKVSGYANLSNGQANFDDLKIIAYLLEPGSMVFQDYPLPYNMSGWCPPLGPDSCESDQLNATSGYYNITLPGAKETANLLLFAAVRNGSGYYGAFKNISLDYSNTPYTDFNFTLYPLLGNLVENITLNNASGDAGGPPGPPGTINVSTKKLAFQLKNATSGANFSGSAHIEIEVDYSAYNGSIFNWMLDIQQSNNGSFKIPAIDANINKINIFTQGSAPLKTSKTAAQLATPPVSINLSSFNPGAINVSEGPPPIFIDMLKNTPLCDVPYPQQGCSLFPQQQQQNMTDFNPFKIVVGGGKISLRMRSNFNNITVHYKNVDMLASGPPDAQFDSNATQAQNGSAMEHARRFGSMGPEIYDEVLIGIPLALGVNANNVSVKFGKLYNESWGEVWNSSSGNTTADLPSDYSAFNLSFFGPGGMQCSTTDQNAPCYVSISDRMVWLTIPHFSGVDTTVSGASGNFTATLNSTALAGNKANLNFTLSDTANTTSWYKFTFQAGFDAAYAIINSTINGIQDPQNWNIGNFATLYVNVSAGDPAAVANFSTYQYINISNITVPSNAGNYLINVTTSNSLAVSLNYTVITYGVNLTNMTELAKTTIAETNTSYTMILQNNGSTTDTYNLTIDNPGGALIAALNYSGNITLASNAARTIVLNVTNTSAGIFRVNVTARSNNDSTKFGYINTTTTVASYGTNLTLSGVFTRTTNAGTNASYTLILHNNGTATDTYNMTIANPGSATTTALNISGNITLASNAMQTLVLNVTNTAGGVFPVNVTARSNNDPTRFGYINTTTTVAVRGVILTNISALAQTTNALTNITYLLNLTNNGTATDAYNLMIGNMNNASIAGINITSPYTLAPGLTQIIALNVTNTTPGTFYVNITATSVNDATKFGYVNTTTIVPNYNVNLTVDSNAKATIAASNATYILTLQNNGTATDTYNLTIDNQGSSTTAALNISGNISLASNAARTILLNVTNITAGTFRINVTARSNNDSTRFGYINTTTTVNSYGVNLTGVSSLSQTVTATNNASYTLILQNNGTASDTYTLTISNPNSASTAALNTSGNITLASNSAQTLILNVTNTSAGTFHVNITARSNNDSTRFGYINTTTVVNSYGVNLTVDSAARTTTATVNATYTLILQNNGSTIDSYNLTVDNPGSASTAAINFSGNLTLAQNAAYTFTLNVTNTTSGTFRVNVTARSNNDSTKFGYINTTTTVNPVPIGATITWPSNNSANTTGYVNVTVTLNITGMALLNWEGTNESMLPAGTGTSFYNNKTGLLSRNYSFKIYANSTDGATNVSETRIVTVNRTNSTPISSIINTSTFIVNATLNITSPSGNVTVTIPNGTNASVSGGAALTSVSIDSLAQVNTTFAENLDSTYKFIGENLTLGPDGARFSPDIQIRFNYTAAQLTAAGIAESELTAKFYNISTSAWEALTIYERNTIADYIIANASHFSTFALIGVPTTTTPTSSSSGGGGGGGGGGGASGENYSNIIVKEKYDKHIYKDKTTSYVFTHSSNPIMFVDITGNVNAGEINTAVEVLKATSTLVKESAPGIVYRDVNIWVGTAGFSVPKNIKESAIKFRVANSWMTDKGINGNEITLLKWKNNTWNNLETKETGKNETFTFFEAKTDSFSSFAISGLKNEAAPSGTATATPGHDETERTQTPVQTEKTAGFEIILSIIAFSAVYLLWRKR